MKSRLYVLIGVFCLGLIGLSLRLFFWQVIKSKELTQEARYQHQNGRKIQAKRGNILASDGSFLAASQSSWLLFVQKSEISLSHKDLANKLGPLVVEEIKEGENAKQKLMDEVLRIQEVLDRKDLVWVPIKHKITIDVKRNIEALTSPEAGFKVKVGLNCNVGDYLSVDEAKELVAYLESHPQITYLQFRPILPRFFRKDEEPELNKEIWNYLDTVDSPRIILSNDKRWDISKKNAFRFDKCRGHFFQPILDADGDVKVCSYHPERDDLSFGNIGERSFREIWASEQRVQAIVTVEGLEYAKVCQACCKLTENNKLLDMVVNRGQMKDANFL